VIITGGFNFTKAAEQNNSQESSHDPAKGLGEGLR
jgi:hypothetical protein